MKLIVEQAEMCVLLRPVDPIQPNVVIFIILELIGIESDHSVLRMQSNVLDHDSILPTKLGGYNV